MLKLHRYRFCLPNLQSPTAANLSRYLQEKGWCGTRFNWRANFGEQNLQFNSAAAECLEFKHLLANLTAKYCPEVMPATYCINDQNWSAVLNLLADKYYQQKDRLLDQVEDLIWILKPALLNNGQQIKIFEQLSQLEQHFLSSNRLGGEHVLQQYLTHPHLLKGHKYSIRMFVIITNYAGAFLYPHGYFNVALYPYQSQEFQDLRSHLTNEHLREDESNVVQIPTQQFDFFPTIYQKIKAILADTLYGLQQSYPQAFIGKRQRSLAIFGFDFMLDANQRVWLLEANHGPCFPTSDDHPLQKYLYYDFWQALIIDFVLPIAKREPVNNLRYQIFEPIELYSDQNCKKQH